MNPCGTDRCALARRPRAACLAHLGPPGLRALHVVKVLSCKVVSVNTLQCVVRRVKPLRSRNVSRTLRVVAGCLRIAHALHSWRPVQDRAARCRFLFLRQTLFEDRRTTSELLFAQGSAAKTGWRDSLRQFWSLGAESYRRPFAHCRAVRGSQSTTMPCVGATDSTHDYGKQKIFRLPARLPDSLFWGTWQWLGTFRHKKRLLGRAQLALAPSAKASHNEPVALAADVRVDPRHVRLGRDQVLASLDMGCTPAGMPACAPSLIARADL